MAGRGRRRVENWKSLRGGHHRVQAGLHGQGDRRPVGGVRQGLAKAELRGGFAFEVAAAPSAGRRISYHPGAVGQA